MKALRRKYKNPAMGSVTGGADRADEQSYLTLTSHDAPNSYLMEKRTKSLPGTSYKLDDTGAEHGLDVNPAGPLQCDEVRMCFWLPYADGSRRDGVGDLLEVDGIILDRHRLNPVVLIDHGKQHPLPLGLTCERDARGV
jgi:hypothetical protein